METCDFSRSFITFITKNRANNARIQVEARCILVDQEAKTSEDYYLVASCKGEDTYGKGILFLIPSYDFCMIYSSNDFMIIRTYLNAERDNTTVGNNRVHFLDVKFHIKLMEGQALENNKDIVKATLDNLILNGRCELESERYKAILEFPIKTMNVNDINNTYQVDTGPILLPDFSSKKERIVECFKLAYLAFNKPDDSYFVIQEPTSIGSEKVSYYSRVMNFKTKNIIISHSG
ncbi:hypothetical protein FJZ33_04075 [Candidatus Poribacteria bacterium]|nr:hypothetical protein [Candidatus Poribacteria bacterium]